MNTASGINVLQFIGFGPLWARLLSTTSREDCHAFQEREGFAHIGKNK